jgi:hypothetical protein
VFCFLRGILLFDSVERARVLIGGRRGGVRLLALAHGGHDDIGRVSSRRLLRVIAWGMFETTNSLRAFSARKLLAPTFCFSKGRNFPVK